MDNLFKIGVLTALAFFCWLALEITANRPISQSSIYILDGHSTGLYANFLQIHGAKVRYCSFRFDGDFIERTGGSAIECRPWQKD